MSVQSRTTGPDREPASPPDLGAVDEYCMAIQTYHQALAPLPTPAAVIALEGALRLEIIHNIHAARPEYKLPRALAVERLQHGLDLMIYADSLEVLAEQL